MSDSCPTTVAVMSKLYENGMNIKSSYRLNRCNCFIYKWAQLGSNQRPPDYECSYFDVLFRSKKSVKLKYLKHLQGFMFFND